MQPMTIELDLLSAVVGGISATTQAPPREDFKTSFKGYLKECVKGAAAGAIGGSLGGPKTAAVAAAVGCTTNMVIRAIDRNL